MYLYMVPLTFLCGLMDVCPSMFIHFIHSLIGDSFSLEIFSHPYCSHSLIHTTKCLYSVPLYNRTTIPNCIVCLPYITMCDKRFACKIFIVHNHRIFVYCPEVSKPEPIIYMRYTIIIAFVCPRRRRHSV